MLTFTSEIIIEEVRWLPNGDLIGLRRAADQESELDNRYEVFSFFTTVELVVWSFPDFSETVLGRYAIPRTRRTSSVLRVGNSGEFVTIRGPECACLRIRDRQIVDSRSHPNCTQQAVSPDGKRILIQTGETQHNSVQFVECCWLDEGRYIRTIWVTPSRPATYFYGPDNKTLYRKRADVSTIERLRIRERPGERKTRIVEYEAIEEQSYSARSGEVAGFWQSLDGTVIGLIQKKFSLIYLEDPLRRVTPEYIGGGGGSRSSVSFHPSNRFQVKARSFPESVDVFDLEGGARIRRFEWGPEQIHSVDCSHDGTMIAAIAGDNKIIVWDVDF